MPQGRPLRRCRLGAVVLGLLSVEREQLLVSQGTYHAVIKALDMGIRRLRFIGLLCAEKPVSELMLACSCTLALRRHAGAQLAERRSGAKKSRLT